MAWQASTRSRLAVTVLIAVLCLGAAQAAASEAPPAEAARLRQSIEGALASVDRLLDDLRVEQARRPGDTDLRTLIDDLSAKRLQLDSMLRDIGAEPDARPRQQKSTAKP